MHTATDTPDRRMPANHPVPDRRMPDTNKRIPDMNKRMPDKGGNR